MNRKVLGVIITVAIILGGIIIFSLKKGSGPSPRALVNQAKELSAKGDLLAAKDIYLKLINDFTNSPEVANWQKKSEELNIKLLFSPVITSKSVLYEIEPGDTLIKIARKFKTTPELIKKSNNLKDAIMPGRKIKVWNAPFSILIDKSNNTLILKCEEEVLKSYVVSTGKDNCTPAGNFKITNKLLNPTWFKKGDNVISPTDPKNALGSRWLGIDLPGYGIHGTIEPQNLGKQATEGCIRMSNPDVEELYIIVPVGTEVTIVD
ncbi:MAG: L,D-transpeptidase family protein [Candidatus Omnitrophota bacterium]